MYEKFHKANKVYIYLYIYLFINQLINLPIYLFIYLSINQSIYLSIYLFIYLFIIQCMLKWCNLPQKLFLTISPQKLFLSILLQRNFLTILPQKNIFDHLATTVFFTISPPKKNCFLFSSQFFSSLHDFLQKYSKNQLVTLEGNLSHTTI